MPRPVPESRLRRFMMQAIMWIILGGTVGLAALLDRARTRSPQPELELSPPKQFDGFSVRLPSGWEEKDSQGNITTQIALSDPRGNMNLNITARPRGLSDWRRGTRRSAVLGKIDFGGVEADLLLRAVPTGPEAEGAELSATRPLGANRVLSISLRIGSLPELEAIEDHVELIKQVAATVKVDANDNPGDQADENQ